MPAATPAAVRKQISQASHVPTYLIVGDDDAEISALVSDIGGLVEDELRAFNLERVYAGEKGVTPGSIVQSARTIPMLGDRRVVVVLRAERILKPKRGGKGAVPEDEGDAEESGAPSDLQALEEYVQRPEPQTTLVLVAAEVDRQRKIYKALVKHATIVECFGLRISRDGRLDLREAARAAETMVRKAAADAGQVIDAPAWRLVASRAGTDISRLRADIDRLLMYTAGKPKITLQDAQEVVSSETAQDDWAVTNAIARGDAAEALRHLGLALESGGVSYQILGQLAWFVRDKLSTSRASPGAGRHRRAVSHRPGAEELRGDPRVLLERLVVDLCRR